MEAAFGNCELKNLEEAPPDPILILFQWYLQDQNPNKVNVGIGAYRTEEGEPYVFPVVREAEKIIVNDHTLNKEYSGIDGLQDFNKVARQILFGDDHPDVNSGRVASAQGMSGTGSVRVIADFLQKNRKAPIYVSTPTWGNHHELFKEAGLEIRQYRYYDPKTKGLDYEGMMEDLKNAESGSAICLHTCAHNPTGVDLTLDQWKEVAKVIKENKLYPFFDTAYQGFVTGDLQKDGEGLRYFLNEGFEMAIAQSFSKTLGLYGERTGALHFVCGDKKTADIVVTHLKGIIRRNYSSPPKHGARIATLIWNTPNLRAQWLVELQNVTARISDMRKALRENVEKHETPGTWNHLTDQQGMFAYTGLTEAQSDAMVKKHHVYMTLNGRMSVSGLNTKNVEYVAKAIKDVVENVN